MSRQESAEERAQRITAELRTATSQAAGVLRDLERVIKNARHLVDEYAANEVSRVMNHHLAQMQALADQWNRDMFADHARVMKRLDESRERIIAALDMEFQVPLQQAENLRLMIETVGGVKLQTKVEPD